MRDILHDGPVDKKNIINVLLLYYKSLHLHSFYAGTVCLVQA